MHSGYCCLEGTVDGKKPIFWNASHKMDIQRQNHLTGPQGGRHLGCWKQKQKTTAFAVAFCLGPSAEIRTQGLLNPIQARYQTSPHPDQTLEPQRFQGLALLIFEIHRAWFFHYYNTLLGGTRQPNWLLIWHVFSPAPLTEGTLCLGPWGSTCWRFAQDSFQVKAVLGGWAAGGGGSHSQTNAEMGRNLSQNSCM